MFYHNILIIAEDKIISEKIERAIREEYVQRFPDILGPKRELYFVWLKKADDAKMVLEQDDPKIQTIVIETSMIDKVGVETLSGYGQQGKNIIPATIIGSIPESQYLNLSAGAGSRFIQY